MSAGSSIPLVSVIVPCFKQAHYLPYSLNSALAQTWPNVEVILIDDGSPDDTPAVARSFGCRIVYHRQPNGGLAAARNKGISLARGELIAFLDADDLFESTAVEARAHPMCADGSIIAACCGWREIDAVGNVTSEFPAPQVNINAGGGGREVYVELLRANPAPPVCWMVAARALRQVGSFNAQFYGHEDWDLWLRLAASALSSSGRSRIISAPGAHVRYRVHGQSMSSSKLRNMFHGGRAMLLSRRRDHRGEPAVRRVIDGTLRTFRQQYVGNSLSQAMSQSNRRVGAVARVLVEIGSEALRDPRIAWEVVRGCGKFAARGLHWPFRTRGG